MLLLNLLQDPKPGRPLMTGRSHRGDPCLECKSTEKIWDISRGVHAGKYRYERCALCARRARKGEKRATPQTGRRRNRNAEQIAQNAKRWRKTNPEKAMFIDARRRAKGRNLEFTIDLDDVVIPECCPLLGIEIARGVGAHADSSPSLDRIDSARGYVKGNVWVISWRANVIKRDATLDELRLIVAGLERV
jgi:hypothetical protein